MIIFILTWLYLVMSVYTISSVSGVFDSLKVGQKIGFTEILIFPIALLTSPVVFLILLIRDFVVKNK